MSELLSNEEFEARFSGMARLNMNADIAIAERTARLAAESRLAEVEAENSQLREALQAARVDILWFIHSRWSEYEGDDDDVVGYIDAALERAALSKEKT